MKILPLSEEELNVVLNNPNHDDGDIFILEMIKGMDVDEMSEFDKYTAKDKQHYKNVQISWLETEKHLLYERPCNCHNAVPEELLIRDFEECHNGLRFRAFYCIKFRHMIEKLNIDGEV